MIIYGAFITVVVFCLLTIWLLAVRLDHESSLPDSVVGVLVMLIIATIALGLGSTVTLVEETKPQVVPIFVKVPTLVER